MHENRRFSLRESTKTIEDMTRRFFEEEQERYVVFGESDTAVSEELLQAPTGLLQEDTLLSYPGQC